MYLYPAIKTLKKKKKKNQKSEEQRVEKESK